jgi:hypothetical protein
LAHGRWTRGWQAGDRNPRPREAGRGRKGPCRACLFCRMCLVDGLRGATKQRSCLDVDAAAKNAFVLAVEPRRKYARASAGGCVSERRARSSWANVTKIFGLSAARSTWGTSPACRAYYDSLVQVLTCGPPPYRCSVAGVTVSGMVTTL